MGLLTRTDHGGSWVRIPFGAHWVVQLHLFAKKNGNKKVIDKKVDFDTIDLLTKRFNSQKKCSPLSKMFFDELNRISQIPIHKTSKKINKLNIIIIYFNGNGIYIPHFLYAYNQMRFTFNHPTHE